MNKARIYSTLVGVAAGATMFVMPVVSHAATMDCTQSMTGSSSVNTCTNSRNRNIGVNRNSNRNIIKFTLHTSTTGFNVADNNTGSGMATGGMSNLTKITGNAVSDLGMSVSSSPLSSQDGTNSTTGASSVNVINLSDDLHANVTSTANTTIDTTAIVDHNTGFNSASHNTGSGTAMGGDAMTTLTTTNTVLEGPVTVSL